MGRATSSVIVSFTQSVANTESTHTHASRRRRAVSTTRRPAAPRADAGGRTEPVPPQPTGGVDVVADEVVKRYGPIQALRGVSITVSESEFVTITGPSGSGKSTLLNLIGSLDQPDSGTVTVGGIAVPEPQRATEFRRRIVGFVFQDNLLLPYLTAQANVESALIATGVGRKERRARSLELLAEVGLADRAGHLPAELSGGQRQGASLARALANDPRLLLADEPTGALDSDSARRALELLAGLRDSRGMTVIVVSHDTAVAERGDRVIHLVDGQVVAD
jgi:putative ABC transport system ATP-binding protein